MTRLYDDPASFADDAFTGFLNAHADRVVGVPGGVVRSTETPRGKVAVVVGGGSGHYPAFCGVVGPGFADGAVVGNIFTSPSYREACSVGRAAASDAGLLFSTGNYAGDVMNFTLAREQLAKEGIDTRLVFVTDDIASAPAKEATTRRGIAGDVVVFKVAGAAAEEGYDLDGVERVALRANDRTRTLGVAFAGCTMPGQDEPLFAVPPGRMGVGLGIHGEPGVSEDDLPRAADLARLLVDGVLAEKPADSGPRVAVILNGLGDTKYEELFVLWNTVSRLLHEAGLVAVEPEVGELVTSLDMAGCSLTLTFLDEELERLWCAPADTPAYRKNPVPTGGERRQADDLISKEPVVTAGSTASTACAATAVRALERMAEEITAAEDELARLDAVAGDGDHGRGMVKGVTSAVEAARHVQKQDGGAASVLGAAGDEWAARAGGTSGVLWGAALRTLGDRLGDDSATITPTDVTEAVREAASIIQRLGKAEQGDKTMLDALIPFAEALEQAVADGMEVSSAWVAAARTAREAAQGTAKLRPKVGRARPLADRSVGTPDPGALSMALCLRAVGEVLEHGVAPESHDRHGRPKD